MPYFSIRRFKQRMALVGRDLKAHPEQSPTMARAATHKISPIQPDFEIFFLFMIPERVKGRGNINVPQFLHYFLLLQLLQVSFLLMFIHVKMSSPQCFAMKNQIES